MSLRGFLIMRRNEGEENPPHEFINFKVICYRILHILIRMILVIICGLSFLIYNKHRVLGTICIIISLTLLLIYLVIHDNTSRAFILRSRERSLDMILGNNINSAEDPVNIACSICLEFIKIDERYTKLKCNHVYHRVCIHDWLIIKSNCPLCRISVDS